MPGQPVRLAAQLASDGIFARRTWRTNGRGLGGQKDAVAATATLGLVGISTAATAAGICGLG